MNSFYCENQGTYTYMVYELEPGEELDNLSLGMMINNKIKGISPVIRTQMNETQCLKYNVSAKVSLAQYLTGTLNRDRILKIFLSITDAVLTAEEYMIDQSSFLFHADYIFVNVSTAEAEIICLPIIGLEHQDISNFFKNIMFNPNTTFDSTENCDYVAKIINHLNSTTTFSLANFKELLISLQRNANTNVGAAKNAAAILGGEMRQQTIPSPQQNRIVKPNLGNGTPVNQPAVKPIQSANSAVGTQPKVNENRSINNDQILSQKKADSEVQPNMPASDMGFAIPGMSSEQVKATQIPPSNSIQDSSNESMNSNQKSMSMLYLLRNYSKENAAIYKAQKQEKKNQNGEKEGKKSKRKTKKATNESFSVPNEQNHGFVPQQTMHVEEGIQNQGRNFSPEAAAYQWNVNTQTSDFAREPMQEQSRGMRETISIPTPMSNANTTVNFGETTVLNGGTFGETTVLSQMQNPQQMSVPQLVRTKNSEKIMINKPVYRIGKERSYVDYFIADNTAISRSHANIIVRDGKYYIVDTNSTNHTYVNGQMIQSNMEVEIIHGDIIRLANEEFEFKLY